MPFTLKLPEAVASARTSADLEEIATQGAGLFSTFILRDSHALEEKRSREKKKNPSKLATTSPNAACAPRTFLGKCGALGRGFVGSPRWSFVPRRAAAGLGSEIRQHPAQNKHSCDSRKTARERVFSCGRLCAHDSSYLRRICR